MKAVAPRIERLYEAEVQRWRAAWERVFDALQREIRQDEKDAFRDLQESTIAEGIQDGVFAIIGAWLREAGCPQEAPDSTEGDFWDLFWGATPEHGLDVVDLSRWPSDLPKAPPDADGREWKLCELCRRDKGKGKYERMAAGYLLMQISMARVSRIYSRR